MRRKVGGLVINYLAEIQANYLIALHYCNSVTLSFATEILAWPPEEISALIPTSVVYSLSLSQGNKEYHSVLFVYYSLLLYILLTLYTCEVKYFARNLLQGIYHNLILKNSLCKGYLNIFTQLGQGKFYAKCIIAY